MLMKAIITTPWAGDGSQDSPNHPQIQDDYQINSYQDITGQPGTELSPEPNMFVAEITLEQAVLDQVILDERYAVLSAEEIIEETMI
jgi:hypothetical protein